MPRPSPRQWTLSEKMDVRVDELAQEWGVHPEEALRRIFGIGEYFAVRLLAGQTILTEDENGKQTTVVFEPPPGEES